MVHTSVEIVKPGGTGRPALVISARPDPLPPRVSFMVRLPSALPLPKKYTNCFGFEADLVVTRLTIFLCAMNETTPLRNPDECRETERSVGPWTVSCRLNLWLLVL